MQVHWNNSPRVDMSLHSDTLFEFRANQYLLFLLSDACLAEKQQTNFIVFGLIRCGLEPITFLTFIILFDDSNYIQASIDPHRCCNG